MAIRLLSAFAAGVAVAVALSACSVPSRRTTPDQVERAAVAAAQLPATYDRVPVDDGGWVQLWTPTQAGIRIAKCVDRGSEGLVEFTPGPLALNTSGLTYTVGLTDTTSSADSRVGPPSFDGATVQRLVDRCIADHPADFRLFAVPARDRAALYAYDATLLRRCLMSHGQQVPRLPTRERFERLIRASAPWNADELVVVKDRAAWYALADACPLLPTSIAGDVASATTSATTP